MITQSEMQCSRIADRTKSALPRAQVTCINRFRCVFAIAVLLIASCRVSAAVQEIVCTVNEKEFFVSESITYQVDIQNAESPNTPDVTSLGVAFDVEFIGDQSRNQSSTMIINGRMSQSSTFSHVYQYRLTAKLAGELKIPPVSALIDGKTLTSNSVSVRVLDIPKQDSVLVEIVSSKSKVYPTQSFSVKLRILVQPLSDSNAEPVKILKQLRRDPPSIQISWLKPQEGLSASAVSEWLQPLISRNNAGFTINEVTADSGSIFERRRSPVFDLSNGREKREGLGGEPIDYFVYELERSFVAEKAGAYNFGPAIVRGSFEKKFIAIAPSIGVEVREVPTPRPGNFTGGIGNYSVKASATPTKLRVGDPMTLTLQFAQGENSGSLELISAPDLSAIPQISDNFDIVDKNPVGRLENRTKKFAFGLRPKRAGVSLPELSFSTFDPTSASFTNILTAPIAITVSEATSTVSSGDLVGSIGSASATKDIKTRSEGIFHNVTDPALVYDQQIDLFSGLKWIAGLWVGTGIAIASLMAFRLKSSDVERLRRATARRTAHSRLSTAKAMLTQGRAKESQREVRTAIFGLVADTRNQIADGMTTADVQLAMVAAAVPDVDRERLQGLLERIESAEYGASRSTDSIAFVEEASELIDRVGRCLERRSAR